MYGSVEWCSGSKLHMRTLRSVPPARRKVCAPRGGNHRDRTQAVERREVKLASISSGVASTCPADARPPIGGVTSRSDGTLTASFCLSGSVRNSVKHDPRTTSKYATSFESLLSAANTPGESRKLAFLEDVMAVLNAMTEAPEDTLHCFHGARNRRSCTMTPPPMVPTTTAWPSLPNARQLGTPSRGTAGRDQLLDRLLTSQP
mmetsp:Transcript_65253/g.172984  ORF Transcript_65253/g.172984 Transcript_65253/m.172984 type:complete len:203 (-) Transcript_65253:3766-4374(-)